MNIKTVVTAIAIGAGALAALPPNSAQAQAAPEIKAGPNGEIVVLGTFTVTPGAEGEFEQVARRSIRCSRMEPGHVAFTMHKSLVGPGSTYVLYEVWRDEAALESHFHQPYTQALFRSFEQTLEAPPDLKFLAELAPAPRAPRVTTDPASAETCR